MSGKKSWPLILGMVMLVGGGTVTAQASPLNHDYGQSPAMHGESMQHKHTMEFEQSPQERRKMLALLNISEDRFERQIRHGKSIAEIAANRDVPLKTVIRLIEDQMKDHIEQDKRRHHITPQQAAEMKKHVREQAREIVQMVR